MLIIGNGFLGKNIHQFNQSNKLKSYLISLRKFNTLQDKKLLEELYSKNFDTIVFILGAGQERNFNLNMFNESTNLLNFSKKFYINELNKFRLRLITSGGTIYGFNKSSNFSERSTLTNDNSEYGKATQYIEKLFLEYFPPTHFNSISLRVGNVVSSFFNNDHYGLINKIITSAKLKIKFNLFVPMETRRDFLSTKFLVSTLNLLENDNTFEGKINIANIEKHRIFDVIELVKDKFPDLVIENNGILTNKFHDYNMDTSLLFKNSKIKPESLSQIITPLF